MPPDFDREPLRNRPPGPARDARAAEWIAPRLLGDFGAVCRTVPAGFDAYARIMHPADPGTQPPVRWSELARRNGRIMHALAQFDRIASPSAERPGPGGETDVAEPSQGDLAADQLDALRAILAGHTAVGQRCWYALWEGWGEFGGAVSFAWLDGAASPRPAPREWQLDLRAATFELPGRRYYLFTGSLDDATRFGHWVTRDWFLPRSPNLFWPDDQTWCVASEIDFDSTLVGGSAQLIADIVRSEHLEAWPVGPRDSVALDGDVINGDTLNGHGGR